jgi:hypothetical protein
VQDAYVREQTQSLLNYVSRFTIIGCDIVSITISSSLYALSECYSTSVDAAWSSRPQPVPIVLHLTN